jgi:uncharacterized protein
MRAGPATFSTVRGSDLLVVAGQLGRWPRAVSRIMARCPFEFPAVVESAPYDGRGRPFPTLYYCTCPTLVAQVSTLESSGGVRMWAWRASEEPALADSLAKAVRATRRRRRELARRCGGQMIDGGASLAAGIGGVRDVRTIKCLHAHVAHALARPGYVLGESVAAELSHPWCDDRRCSAFIPEEPGVT